MKTITTACRVAGCFFAVTCVAQTQFKTNLAHGTIYVNQEYTAPDISKIIVFSGVHDIGINKKIIDLFYDIGIRGTNGLLLFPPLKNYTEDELVNLSREKDFDAMIWVEIKNKTSSDNLRSEVELSIHDLPNNVRYARVFGYGISSVTTPDKAILRFFEAVIPELHLGSPKTERASKQ